MTGGQKVQICTAAGANRASHSEDKGFGSAEYMEGSGMWNDMGS